MTIGFAIIFFAFILHETCKAFGDAILWRGGESPFQRYINTHPWVWQWIARDALPDQQGDVRACGMWHFFDGHVRQFSHHMGSAGGIIVGIAFTARMLHAPTMYGALTIWLSVAALIPIGWGLYRIGGLWFTLLFHVVLMGDWTFRKWLTNALTF